MSACSWDCWCQIKGMWSLSVEEIIGTLIISTVHLLQPLHIFRLSVTLVTTGAKITTLSAPESRSSSTSPINPHTYPSGIGILTLALVLSRFFGLVQDWTYSKYIQPSLSSPKQEPESSPWQESMSYLHFLALPMLLPLLAAQMKQLNAIGPRADFSFRLPIPPLSILPQFIL